MLAVTRASTSGTGLLVRVEGELRRRQSGPYHLWWGGRGLLLRNLRPFWLFLAAEPTLAGSRLAGRPRADRENLPGFEGDRSWTVSVRKATSRSARRGHGARFVTNCHMF